MLEANGFKVLVDCGLYQERELKARNWAPFPILPRHINAVLLTHAHLDHCGLLPKLVRNGFHGPIYCTSATAELAEIILLDSAHILQEDADFKRRRHEREGRKGPYPEVPLYNTEDAQACFPLFKTVRYGESISIGEDIEATFHDAGHVLGSSTIKLAVRQFGERRTIIFSGDIGRWKKPILRDPTVFEKADYIVMESTYGDKATEKVEETANQLADIISMTAKEGGNIVIPSFALERSQEILYYLNKFLLEERIPHLLVFVDSPMAVSITEIFKRHPELVDDEMRQLLHKDSPFEFPGLHMVRTVEESKAINHIKGSVIITAGSGMCTGGRIKHHLVSNITRPESTILFVGYQATGTLGRQIVDISKIKDWPGREVRILGQNYPVRARVFQLHGFSAHADREELLRWLTSVQKPPRRVFITHGELEISQRFASLVSEKTGWETSLPHYHDKVLLE